MLTDKFIRAFDRCFSYIKDSDDAILEKSALYCTAQWICDSVNNKPIEYKDMQALVKSAHMQKIRRDYLFDRFSIEGRDRELYILCDAILKIKFLDNRAKYFYYFYLPCAISNMSILDTSDALTLINSGPVSCTLIHLSLALAEGRQGTKEIFGLLSTDVFTRWEKTFELLNVTEDEFEQYWFAVHYLETMCIMRKRPKVEKALKAYQHYRVPSTILLEHYAQAKHFDPMELRRTANPWEFVQKKRGNIIQESGMSYEEELFNTAAYQISREYATEVIHSIFYKNRDDSPMEAALLRSVIKRLIPNSNRVLIINPSPAFLMLFDEIRKSICQADGKEDDKQIVFVVPDQVVAFLYREQFQKDRFIVLDDVQKEQGDFDLVVILARDQELPPLWRGLEKCKKMGAVAMLVPQTVITETDSLFLRRMEENQIYMDWIMDVPPVLTQSNPRKKMLIFGRRGEVYKGRNINLLQAVVHQDAHFLTLVKEKQEISPELLTRGLTLVKLRALAREAKEKGKVRPVKESLVYNFSDEIKIRYNIIKVNGKVDRARAYYRNIHRPDTEINRSKGKRPNDINTERGLRGKSEAEIIRKLEQVAFYDEYYDLIAADIKDHYKDELSRLTVKTLWFCCRRELLSRISYDENIALELFCGENQSLSNLVACECMPENLANALDRIYGEDEAGKKVWLQLHLIFQVAVEEGMLEKNPLISFLHVVREKNRERIYLLNAALKKTQFTNSEERRMVDYLCEQVPLPGRKTGSAPRYVVESKWLAGAFSLFAGLPVREICPLLWGDLRQIDDMEEMQLAVTKHLNSSNAVISTVYYGNKEHFRKVAVDLILGRMLMERKHYLMSFCGYTEDSLASVPIMLESEPTGRGRKKHTMISRATVRKVNRTLLEEAGIEANIISLLDGDARFDVDLNAYRNDLFAANFRHKAYNVCGYTTGELCYHVGNKAPDTYCGHYCDYGNDFMQYDMVRKLYRWTFVYDVANQRKIPFGCEGLVVNEAEYTTGRFANGTAHAELTLKPDLSVGGDIVVEIECAHGLDGEIVALERGGAE